jgi:hypothetical protein
MSMDGPDDPIDFSAWFKPHMDKHSLRPNHIAIGALNGEKIAMKPQVLTTALNQHRH